MDNKDIEKLVTTITERVRERLSKSENHCNASATDCTSCGLCVERKEGVVTEIVESGAERIGSTRGVMKVKGNLASMIDHTLLAPDATRADLDKMCIDAIKYSFATVCVNPSNVEYVAKKLAGTSVKPIAVVGFPLGASITNAKVFEAREAIRRGAREIDMVLNIGALKSYDFAAVFDDIYRVVIASKPYKVKVILETALLSDEEKVIACVISKIAGAAFVKTSTGFSKSGATVHDIELMRRIVGKNMGVKASGGIRTHKDAESMIRAGADRIGASASVAIVTCKGDEKGY